MELKLKNGRITVNGETTNCGTINQAVLRFAAACREKLGPVVEVGAGEEHFLVINHENGQVLFDSASEATGRSVK